MKNTKWRAWILHTPCRSAGAKKKKAQSQQNSSQSDFAGGIFHGLKERQTCQAVQLERDYDNQEQKDKKCLDSVLVLEWTNKKFMGLWKEKRQDLTKELGDRKEDESDTGLHS